MMQRPRNRQGRPDSNRGNERGRGRGRGRGFRGQSGGGRDSSYSTNVPSIAQVISGAHVSIVLKMDQGTGRQVQGTVSDVLTSGNHPRGIKVRLVDGRVGRVQNLVTEDEANAGSMGLSNLGRNGEPVGTPAQSFASTNRHTRPNHGARYRDVREEADFEAPPTGYSLGDFLPPDHPLQRNTPAEPENPARADGVVVTTVCPVCNEFEGDETAVAHHVSSHFD